MTAPAIPELEPVTEGSRAAALFQHPVRRRILALARTPMSATEMAGRLGLPRQRVNYHVRQLERARFLERADQRVRRNMIEQRYVASARSYVIAPALLGALAPHTSAVQDAASAAALFAIASRAQDDLTRVVAEAGAQSKRVSTLSVTTDVRFTSAEQRAEFTRAIEIGSQAGERRGRKRGRSLRRRLLPVRRGTCAWPSSQKARSTTH